MNSMKRFFFTSRMLSMLLIFAMTFSTVSCDEDDDYNPTKTILETAQGTDNLSIFFDALRLTGLDATLGNKDASYTVFAPTNQAFTAFLQAKEFDGLNDPDLPVSELRQLLLNHVVNIETATANLPRDGYVKTMATSTNGTDNKLSLYVNKTSGTRLNGTANVTKSDIRATNGVVHIVDGVIDLPTITAHLRANRNFSGLFIIMPGFADMLSGPETYTVFAPTVDAYTTLQREQPGLSEGDISNILHYHIVSGKILANALTNGPVNTRLVSQTFTVNITNGLKITDARSNVINIGTTDIECTNGVIHAVDRFLLPTL